MFAVGLGVQPVVDAVDGVLVTGVVVAVGFQVGGEFFVELFPFRKWDDENLLIFGGSFGVIFGFGVVEAVAGTERSAAGAAVLEGVTVSDWTGFTAGTVHWFSPP